MWFLNTISIGLFCLVKIISGLFYKTEVEWINDPGKKGWAHDVRLFIFLNHTSLFEPLFVSAVPFHFLFWGAPRVVVPGADKTLKRPLVGSFFKLLCPRMISITRKRDHTWDEFLSVVEPNSLVIILPEGRMMRRNGLDASGQRMSVRGGVADILGKLDSGRMIIGYSGGLHHVQAPGEKKIRLFQKLRIRFETVDIVDYKASIVKAENPTHFKSLVVQDLEARQKRYCPVEHSPS